MTSLLVRPVNTAIRPAGGKFTGQWETTEFGKRREKARAKRKAAKQAKKKQR